MFLRTGAFFSSILSEFLKNLVALQSALVGNLLFRLLKDGGLSPACAGVATLAFALVLYLAALQAQGVELRAFLRHRG